MRHVNRISLPQEEHRSRPSQEWDSIRTRDYCICKSMFKAPEIRGGPEHNESELGANPELGLLSDDVLLFPISLPQCMVLLCASL